MSIANLSAEDRKNMEEQIKDRRPEIQPTYQHYGPVEDMSENDIRIREAQVKASRSEVKPTYQHYGSVEDMSEEQIQGLEAQIRARNHEVEPIYQHNGSVENMDEESRKVLEAHVAEKRKEDLPHEKYFDALDESLTITDEEQFETAVARSMQSNRIMRDFTSNLVGKISGAVHELKGMDGVDKEGINNQKQKIEKLVGLYERYLYTLKEQGWNFNGADNESGIETIGYDTLDEMARVQRQFDVTFTMPIPRNLGEDYGKAFEREGVMIAAIPLMYDDLKNKDVNWHRVLIYRENELTPYQRYRQRKEAAEKQFDSTRQEEIRSTLAYSRSQNEMDSMLSNTENKGQVDTASMRVSK